MQLYLRKVRIEKMLPSVEGVWPIDKKSERPPLWWEGWPNRKRFAVVLTHDVEKEGGQDKCPNVMRLEDELGFRSAFNFVPERYAVSETLRNYLTENGWEVGVHDYNHDGKLFKSYEMFKSRLDKINAYLKSWDAVGFRAGAMHHNLEWIGELDIDYDCSTFDTDPFEPQPDGVETIFPFWVKRNNRNGGYVELPYTLPQDFTLFVLMEMKTIDVWKRKLDWIAEKGGMVLVNTHPDYMHFDNGKCGLEEYQAERYWEFLQYVAKQYQGAYWHDVPREAAKFWRRSAPREIAVLDKTKVEQ